MAVITGINHLVNCFHMVSDRQAVMFGIQRAMAYVGLGGIFLGDNLFTFHKNLSFLRDPAFMAAFNRHAGTALEQATIWRIYTLCWAAKRSLRVPGDFVECACYKGTTARIVCDYLDFGASGREYFLYDLFEHKGDPGHRQLSAHDAGLYDTVRARFADLPNVHVTQGRVPEVLETIAPQTIAMMHIDLNNADAEVGTLKKLFDRVSPGGAIVLDDYGWLYYQDQKIAEDAFFAELGYDVLELPTGQGLIIK